MSLPTEVALGDGAQPWVPVSSWHSCVGEAHNMPGCGTGVAIRINMIVPEVAVDAAEEGDCMKMGCSVNDTD